MTDEERAKRLAGIRESMRQGTFSNATAEIVLAELDRLTEQRETFRHLNIRCLENERAALKERDALADEVAERDAQCAAMREALESVALLERLARAEAERDEVVGACQQKFDAHQTWVAAALEEAAKMADELAYIEDGDLVGFAIRALKEKP